MARNALQRNRCIGISGGVCFSRRPSSIVQSSLNVEYLPPLFVSAFLGLFLSEPLAEPEREPRQGSSGFKEMLLTFGPPEKFAQKKTVR